MRVCARVIQSPPCSDTACFAFYLEVSVEPLKAGGTCDTVGLPVALAQSVPLSASWSSSVHMEPRLHRAEHRRHTKRLHYRCCSPPCFIVIYKYAGTLRSETKRVEVITQLCTFPKSHRVVRVQSIFPEQKLLENACSALHDVSAQGAPSRAARCLVRRQFHPSSPLCSVSSTGNTVSIFLLLQTTPR